MTPGGTYPPIGTKSKSISTWRGLLFTIPIVRTQTHAPTFSRHQLLTALYPPRRIRA